MIPFEKLTKVTDRYRALEIAMSEQAQASPEEFVRLSKEYADLSPVVQAVHELEDLDRELADLAGIQQSHLSRLETGTTRTVDLDVLDRIAAALKVHSSKLLEQTAD